MVVKRRNVGRKGTVIRNKYGSAIRTAAKIGKVVAPMVRSALKNRYGRTRTITEQVRRNRQHVYGPGTMYQFNRVQGPRFKYNLRGVTNLVKSTTTARRFVLDNVSSFGGTHGASRLLNWRNSNDGVITAPMHMYDVSAVHNVGDAPSVANKVPVVKWDVQLFDDTPTSTMRFIGSISNPYELWQSEIGSNKLLLPTSSTSAVGDKSLLKYVQAKFLFYSATDEPAKFKIDFVRFKDERLVPPMAVNDGITTPTKNMDTFTAAFYQQFLKNYMYNPICPELPEYRKYVEYLYSDTFILNPKDSTEPVNANTKIHNIFKRFNTVMNYKWDVKDRMNMNSDDVELPSGWASMYPHPTRRVFMIVRALSKRIDSAELPDIGPPSYDIFLRAGHVSLNS